MFTLRKNFLIYIQNTIQIKHLMKIYSIIIHCMTNFDR